MKYEVLCLNSTLLTFTITVSSVNDRPSFTATNPVATAEDAGLQTLTSWATFNPGAVNETGQTAIYSVSNITNPTLFAVAPSVAANGTLTYRAAPDAFGTATFDILVTDDGGTANGGINTSVLQTFTITITPVNDAPSFIPGANQTVAAGAGAQTLANWITSFIPGPVNEASQTAVAYTVVGNSNPGLFSVQPAIAADGTLTYTPVASLTNPGTATITLQVQDNGGTPGVDTSSTQTFTITVNPQTVSLNALDSTAAESGGDTGLYRVSRTTTGGSQTIQLAIAGASTATLTSDYGLSLSAASLSAGATLSIVGTTLTIVLPNGVASADIILNAVDDIQAEAAETVTLNLLAGPTYAVSGANTGTVSIDQNDFVVINTNDSGEGSLRQAVLNANAIAGINDVTFSLGAGAQTINLATALPDLSDSVNILNSTGANNLTIQANTPGAFNIFTVSRRQTASFAQLTLRAGNVGIEYSGTISSITNSIISGNREYGIFGDRDDPDSNIGSISNSTFSGNGLSGLFTNGTIGSISNSTFSGNGLSGLLAGPTGSNETIGSISNSTFSGNTQDGLSIGGTVGSISNSTFSGNTENGISSGSDITDLRNNTIAGNGGQGVSTTTTIANLFNNLIMQNGDNTVGGTVINQSNNLTGTFAALNVSPTLTNNGGSTLTHALLPGSAAINAGTSIGAPTTDQRGIARVGAVDIGAFESRGFTITTTSGTPQSAVRNTAFGNPLVATVSSAFGETVDGGVITFTAPGTGASTAVTTQTATIAAGLASVSETANNTVGTYSVTASANGIATPTSFSLTNTNTRPIVTNVRVVF